MAYDPPASGGRERTRDPLGRGEDNSYDGYFRQPAQHRHARSEERNGELDQVRRQPAPRQAGYDRPGVPAQSGDSWDRSARPGRTGHSMTTAGAFWYVLGCIAFGGMYFAKVPVKKALEEAGMATMTSAERFWYVLQCLAFGAGYFAKLPVAKALSEAQGRQRQYRAY